MESKNEPVLLRLYQVIGSRERRIESIMPISASVWWKLVREKKAPQPVKIGRSTFWYRDEVYTFVESWRKSRLD